MCADDKGLYTKGWQTKMGVSGYKVLAYTLMLNIVDEKRL
jgi:hypothetical protein